MFKCFIIILTIQIFLTNCGESNLKIITDETSINERGSKELNITDIKSNPDSNCNYENCPIYQGVCYQGKCLCAYGWTTKIQPGDPSIFCNYKQKSKMTAFFLEFFFPIGAGHLYAGKLIMAIIKFSLFIIFFMGMCGGLCCINLDLERSTICSGFVILTVLCIWAVFQIVDLVCYSFGIYTDGYGIAMI